MNPFKYYTNIGLWELAEQGEIEKGDVFKDREGNQIYFTGKSFQEHYSVSNENVYVGMCLNDEWIYVGNFYQSEV